MPEHSTMSVEIERLREEVRALNEMLAGALDLIESCEEPARIDFLSDATQRWWSAYKTANPREDGAARREREIAEMRATALAKLTSAERRALGFE